MNEANTAKIELKTCLLAEVKLFTFVYNLTSV